MYNNTYTVLSKGYFLIRRGHVCRECNSEDHASLVARKTSLSQWQFLLRNLNEMWERSMQIHGGRGWWWRGETLFVSELTETSYSKTKQTKGTNNLSFSEPGTPNIRCDTGKVDGYHQSPSSQACSSSQLCSLYALLPLRRSSPCGNRSLAGHWLANVYMILTTCGDPREQNTTLLGSGSMSIPPKDSGLSFCLV